MLHRTILWLVLAAGLRASTPSLTADTLFPALGGSTTVTLHGDPGATFLYLIAFEPAEIPLGAKGTLYLEPTGFLILLTGTLPAGGATSLPLPIPPVPEFVGGRFYLQGATKAGGVTRLSNALPFRIEATPPAGPRNPVAIAATPDGARAFVACAEDASLAVVDPIAGVKLLDLPVGGQPHDVAVDGEGRHVVVVSEAAPYLTLLDAGNASVTALLPVPLACRRAVFDLPRLYVTNARDDVVLVFEEGPPGTFTSLPPLELQGDDPSSLAVLPDGRLAVGNLATHDVEILDPALGTTVDVAPLLGLPHDLLVVDGELLVPTFDFSVVPGRNRVLRLSLATFDVLGVALQDVGTDYVDLELAGDRLGVVAAGSGTLLVASASTLLLQQHLDVGPGGSPNANPQRAAVAGTRLLVAEYFRETVRPVELSAGPPFALLPEIPLAHAGVPLVPLADLSPEDDGEWFFRSVELLNGTPLGPNPQTCATCHPRGGADSITHGRQTIPLWEPGATAPFGWKGQGLTLPATILGAFNTHSVFGGSPPPGSVQLVIDYLDAGNPPPSSPFLLPDGGLSAEAQLGEALFAGAAGCAECHVAPLFIPQAPDPLTLPLGVGTGLLPANVPGLRGLWASAPYLSSGAAATLEDVLLDNAGDLHGATSGLSASQRAELAAYLRSL